MVQGGKIGVSVKGKRLRRAALAALMLTSSLGVVGVAAPAQAQEAARDFNIPAQPLANAITAFGQQSGLQVSAQAPLVEGRTSSAVRGALPPLQALSQLLTGTGLSFRVVGSTVTLEPAPQASGSAIQLGPVRVEGEGSSGGYISLTSDPHATEGTGSYTTSGVTATATGLALTLRETPQSITVITTQQALDRNDRTLQDVLRYAPGINAVRNTGDSRWWYYSRGFQIENFQYDGVNTFSHFLSGRINSQSDMAMFDRIEVVRGATGLMTGAGDPSGSVNLMRKRATIDPLFNVEATGSTIGKAGLTADISQSLDQEGKVRGRLVATGFTGAASQRRYNDRDYALIYGTLDFDLTERTAVSIGGSYAVDNTDGYDWGGLPTALDGSFYPFYNSKSTAALPWEYADIRQAVGYFDIEHKLGGSWSLKATGRASIGDSEIMSSRLYRTSTGGFNRGGSIDRSDSNSYSGDVHINGPITVFGREHSVVAGITANRDKSSYNDATGYYWSVPDVRYLDQPSDKNTYSEGPYWSETTTQQYGAYLVGRFELTDQIHLIAGSRLAWYKAEQAANWGGNKYEAKAEVIPYFGTVFDLTKDFTLYASYTRVFKPQNYASPSGSLLAPVKGENYEVGLKAAVLDERLQFNLAVFQSDQTGLPVVSDDTCQIGSSICYNPSAKIRTRGIDTELVGQISGNFNLSTSYSYSDPEYVEGPNKGLNYNTNRMPRHIAKIYARYEFDEIFNGLTVGGGLRFQSDLLSEGVERYSKSEYRIHQSEYALLDLMFRFKFANDTEIQANIDNVFNKNYYVTIQDNSYSNSIGDGRIASIAIRHRF